MLHIKLRELRESKKLTQADVADILNITRGAYAMYESDKRQMNYESLCILADFYNVSTDYFLGHNSNDMIRLDDDEKILIEKYRKLDNRGQQNLISILDIEYSRTLNEN